MAVQYHKVVTQEHEGSDAFVVTVPVPARGYLQQMTVVVTAGDPDADGYVDVYSRKVDPAAAEISRAGYRVAERAAVEEGATNLGGVDGAYFLDRSSAYIAYPDPDHPDRVSRHLCVLVKPGSVGTRTYTIRLTITDTILL